MAARTQFTTNERRLAQAPPPAVRGRHRNLVVFHLGGQTYGLPVQAVQEIVPLALLSRPPGLPSVLAGFLNLGGTPLPVLRLDRLFELPEMTPGRYTPLVVLRHPDFRLALMVETVSPILTVQEEAILLMRSQQCFNDCVEGVVPLNNHVLLLLSAERLLLEKEQQCLAEFQDRERTRLLALEDSGQ
jgi:purine-binding chemotaxis protein CheW